MNANDLADLISLLESDTVMSLEIRKMLRKSAATMLRQQQSEIEQLKAENERLFMTMLDMALDEEVRRVREK